MDIRVAVLIDGSFFIRRVQFFYRKYFSHCQRLTAEQTIEALQRLVTSHLHIDDNAYQHLYRIFFYDAPPLDIKLGVDIATLALKKQVDKIILIAGDSDFVPVAKLARVEGIDFILDPLHNNIDEQLNEHIDGLVSFDMVAILQDVLQSEPNPPPKWWHDSK